MKRLGYIAALVLVLSGCGGIPELNTASISTSPAGAKHYANARRAAAICARLPDLQSMYAGFKAIGYRENKAGYLLRNGESKFVGGYFFKDDKIEVVANANGCTIGLVNMTPQQAYELAKPWADKYQGKTNAELGQGLSDLVVQAWRNKTDEHTVMVAAYKTWVPGYRPFDEQPGAFVTLGYSAKRIKNEM